MRVADFSFELPESLIAHYPMPERSSCRLLSLDGPTGALTHGTFTDLLDKLNPGDLLVFNNTRVIPARLFTVKPAAARLKCWLSGCSMISVFWHIFALRKRRNRAQNCCSATMKVLKGPWLHVTTRCLKLSSMTRAACWIFSTLSVYAAAAVYRSS